jgi:glycosyltransferase involved in cell wall biosynthesis
MYYSIIIPCYNAGNHIQDTITEVTHFFENTGKSYELILVDDHSADKTWDIIKDNYASNPNIIAIRLKKNYGQVVSTNIGLYFASGKHIITMDDDLKYSLETINDMKINSEHYGLMYGYIEQKNTIHIVRRFIDFMAGKSFATSFRYIKRELIPDNYFIKNQLEIYVQSLNIHSKLILSKPYKQITTRTNIFVRLKLILYVLPHFPKNKLGILSLVFVATALLFFIMRKNIIACVLLLFAFLPLIWLLLKNRLDYFYNLTSAEETIEEYLGIAKK